MSKHQTHSSHRAIAIILCALPLLFGFTGFASAATKQEIGSKANPRYVMRENGAAVYDQKSGRTWARCSIGQNWKGSKLGCVGIVKSFTYEEAQTLASKSWRIPTADELASLVEYERKTSKLHPVIDEVAFPDLNPSKMVYWSSTPLNESDAYYLDYNDGTLDTDSQKSAYAVRLVRGEQ